MGAQSGGLGSQIDAVSRQTYVCVLSSCRRWCNVPVSSNLLFLRIYGKAPLPVSLELYHAVLQSLGAVCVWKLSSRLAVRVRAYLSSDVSSSRPLCRVHACAPKSRVPLGVLSVSCPARKMSSWCHYYVGRVTLFQWSVLASLVLIMSWTLLWHISGALDILIVAVVVVVMNLCIVGHWQY